MKLKLIIVFILNYSIGICFFRHRIHRIIIEGRKPQQQMTETYKLFLYYRASVGL
jgi:hypothetical protein